MVDDLERSVELEMYWQRLGCSFAQVDRVFDDCMVEAKALLSSQGLVSYIEHAGFLGKLGRGPEPVLVYLEEAPGVASLVG